MKSKSNRVFQNNVRKNSAITTCYRRITQKASALRHVIWRICFKTTTLAWQNLMTSLNALGLTRGISFGLLKANKKARLMRDAPEAKRTIESE